MQDTADSGTDSGISSLRVHTSIVVGREADLPLAAMRTLYRQWLRAPRDAPAQVPRLASLDLARHADDLVVLAVEPTGNYRYLLHGARVALNFGHDMTGRHVSDLPDPIAHHYSDMFATLQRDRQPLYCRADAAAMVSVEYWDRTFLPATENGTTVDRIVVHSVARAWRTPPGAYLELSRSLNHLEEGLCVVDGAARVHTWNRAFIDLYRIDAAALRRNMLLADFVAAARYPVTLPLTPESPDTSNVLNFSADEPQLATKTAEQTLPDGKVLQVRAVRVPDGGVALTVADISERVAADRALRAANETLEARVRERTRELSEAKNRLEATLQALPEAVFALDLDARVTYVNPTADAWCAPKSGMLGEAIETMCELRSEDSGETVKLPVHGCLATGNPYRGDRTSLFIDADGGRRNVLEIITPTKSPDGEVTGLVLVLQDITDSRREERRMHHAATHDDLTGCPNRKALVVDLATSLARLREFGEPSALIFIDLDRFKQVNDEDGHAVGDEFLRLVAGGLRGCVRNDDTVARFGGDEFVVLLKNCPPGQARQLARTIVEELTFVQLTGRKSTHVGSASLGLVCMEDTAVSGDDWLARADEAAYAAKRAGGGRAFVWQPDGSVPLAFDS